jgi:hypothetical protein
VSAALSAIALWAVGDMTLAELVAKLPVIFGDGNAAKTPTGASANK